MYTILHNAGPSRRFAAGGARRRLLLIAYAFPPVGGAGVQRPAKWTKFLPQLGWDVTVLTCANPSVPLLDASLAADVPPETHILRSKTLEPSYRFKRGLVAPPGTASGKLSFIRRVKQTGLSTVRRTATFALQPDSQILWYPDAIRVGSRALRTERHDAVVVTAPPFSSFFVGCRLSRRFRLPLILDYRDEWDLKNRYAEHAQGDRLSLWIQKRLERHVHSRADAVIGTTQASVRTLEQKLVGMPRPLRTACVYNGFDTEEFGADYSPQASAVPAAAPGTFRLVYTGTLWNLTSIAPLVAAVERLRQTDRHLLKRLELVCVGRKVPAQSALLERLVGADCRVRLVDYCDHREAIAWMQSADALCLLLSDVPGSDRVVPAKVFEYLATGKEILAIVPEGETAAIARRFDATCCVPPAEVGLVCDWLRGRLAAPGKVARRESGAATVDQFSRLSQTRLFADLLDQVVSDKSMPLQDLPREPAMDLVPAA